MFDPLVFGKEQLKAVVKSGLKTEQELVQEFQGGFDAMWAQDVAIHVPGFDSAIVSHFHNGIARRVHDALNS